MNDPLNPKLSYSPVGTSSVCFAHGYTTPDWTQPDPDARPGDAHRHRRAQPGAAARLRGHPLPARALPPHRDAYPLLVVHDGGDFLQYAAAKTVLDNLIHRLDVAELVVAFVRAGRPAGRVRRLARPRPVPHRELLPRLEAELPLVGPALRPLPARLELRRGRLAVGRVPVARHLRRRSC